MCVRGYSIGVLSMCVMGLCVCACVHVFVVLVNPSSRACTYEMGVWMCKRECMIKVISIKYVLHNETHRTFGHFLEITLLIYFSVRT